MTQKELLYLEDAYKHEDNIICILNNMIDLLEGEELVSFFESEIKKHKSTKNKLINLMGGDYCE